MEEQSVGLYTLGCKVSQYETEAIAENFSELGFKRQNFTDVCDVYVINTCTVTAEADRKSRQLIRRALKTNPNAIVMVTGCYAQTSAEDIAKIPGVSYVCGTYGKMDLARRALEMLADKPQKTIVSVSDVNESPFEEMSIKESPRTRAYIKIEDGCECRCTYCAIPGARGLVRSKKPESVMDEIRDLSRKGIREVVLTGIETSSYGADFDNYKLIDLLEDLEKEHLVDRIRFGSLTPELMTQDFVNRLSKLPSITPHFHLSMQSGSSTVLALMKRRYNAKQALDVLKRVRDAIPGVEFTTDLMVGFPGETEELFQETLDFVKEARFLACHVFAYSRRKNTPADSFPNQVDESVKADRSRRLISLSKQIQNEILDELISKGEPIRVLLETEEEGVFTAHADNFVEVKVSTNQYHHGDLIFVKPISRKNGILICDVI